jgi:O-antigen/teichoic acid export membrane protein
MGAGRGGGRVSVDAAGDRVERPAPGLKTATLVGRSFSFRLGSQIVSALINVAGMVALGNYLAAEGYGEYAFYYALVPLIASLSDLGVGVIITREVARDRAQGARYLGDAILVKAVTGAVMLAVVLVAAPLMLKPAAALLVCLVTATAIIDFSQDIGMWTFRAHDRQDLEALLLLTSQTIWLGGILIGAWLHAPLPVLLASATVAFAIRLSVGAWMVNRRVYRPRFEPDWTRIRGLIAEGLPFGLAMFLVVLYGRAGVLLLKGLGSAADVGYFNVGYMLSQPLGFISSSFNISAFPSLARAAQRGAEAVRPTLRRAVKFQLLIAFPITVGLVLLAERMIPLLFHGGGFRQSAVALKVIGLGLTLIFMNLMSRYVLAALNEQRAYLRAIVTGLVVNVATSAALIPSLGYLGACVGLLAGELSVLVGCQWILRRYLSYGELMRSAGRPLLAALGMGGVVWLLRAGNVFVLPLVGALVYGVLLLALRALSDDELDILRRVYVSFRLPGSAHLSRRRGPTLETVHPAPAAAGRGVIPHEEA